MLRLLSTKNSYVHDAQNPISLPSRSVVTSETVESSCTTTTAGTYAYGSVKFRTS